MAEIKIWSTPVDLAPAALNQIGDVLRASDYGKDGDEASAQDTATLFTRDVLQSLFMHSARVDVSEATAKLGSELAALLFQSGFMVRDGDLFAPCLRITRWWDLFILGDLRGADRTRDDAVFAVSGTTKTLDKLRLDRPVGHTVDLGCGSGALALRLAKCAVRVTATDINPRAIAFTRANAAMNRIDTVTARLGSLYGPLQGEKAELILGNLPYVLSPDQRHLYRDGDRPGSQILTDAAQGAVEHLVPGGVAQFTCNWPIRGADATVWVRKLAAQTEIDALAIELRRRNPLDHTRNWNRPANAPDPATQLALERRWTDWFAERDIDHIAFGALILRRPNAARNGRFGYFIADRPPGVCGGKQIERMVRAMDGPLTPDSVPVAVPHVVYQQLVHDGTSYTSMPAEFFALESAGIGLTVLPEALAAMLAVDGNISMAEIAEAEDPGHTALQEAYRRGLIDLTVV